MSQAYSQTQGEVIAEKKKHELIEKLMNERK
jgi:hypothetical protein